MGFATTGSATAGSDYTASDSTSVSFAADSATATVTVSPTADGFVEPDETVTLTISAGEGYEVGTANTATGTIGNDDSSSVIAGIRDGES